MSMAKVIKKKILEYTAVLEQDKKDGGFVAIVPALPGCISEGDTFEEAVGNITEAAELYLETTDGKNTPSEERVILAPIRVAA